MNTFKVLVLVCWSFLWNRILYFCKLNLRSRTNKSIYSTRPPTFIVLDFENVQLLLAFMSVNKFDAFLKLKLKNFSFDRRFTLTHLLIKKIWALIVRIIVSDCSAFDNQTLLFSSCGFTDEMLSKVDNPLILKILNASRV